MAVISSKYQILTIMTVIHYDASYKSTIGTAIPQKINSQGMSLRLRYFHCYSSAMLGTIATLRSSSSHGHLNSFTFTPLFNIITFLRYCFHNSAVRGARSFSILGGSSVCEAHLEADKANRELVYGDGCNGI